MGGCFGLLVVLCLFFQAEDGIRDLVRSRGLGDVYKRQPRSGAARWVCRSRLRPGATHRRAGRGKICRPCGVCLLYTSDAADERSSVDLGGRRIIKKKKRDTRDLLAPDVRTDYQSHDRISECQK